MFMETHYNWHRYTDDIPLPCLLFTLNCRYVQEDIERPTGLYMHHFLWVKDGKCRLEIDGEAITLDSGQGFFCRTFVPHNYYSCGKEPLQTAWFTFMGLDGVLDYYGVGKWFLFQVPEFLDRELADLNRRCTGTSTPISRSKGVYALVTDLLEYLFSRDMSLSDQVDTYLENHFTQAISLESIADTMGISRYTLCHRYNEETNSTVMDTLKKIRVAKAKQYLAGTAIPVAKVGELCGFVSPSYFGKIFRESEGCTPKEYRAQNTNRFIRETP